MWVAGHRWAKRRPRGRAGADELCSPLLGCRVGAAAHPLAGSLGMFVFCSLFCLCVSLPLSSCLCVCVSLHQSLCLPLRVLVLFPALCSPGQSRRQVFLSTDTSSPQLGWGVPSSLWSCGALAAKGGVPNWRPLFIVSPSPVLGQEGRRKHREPMAVCPPMPLTPQRDLQLQGRSCPCTRQPRQHVPFPVKLLASQGEKQEARKTVG